ncbi:MAG: endonuclease/exonuclease/phosphatase family protein, partial [Gammaproteobacteria bacterium]|nr:endonuclease/exonuclease/phosphatase family protein [Gammaproteobacteria bacterium]
VVLGDFNIAPEDADVYEPEAWQGKILCSDKERSALQAITDLGFVDTFRLFDQEDNTFSWWDYRAAGFRRNHGLRIDLILASTALEASCSFSVVDKAPRSNERPSDHAPVIAEFM